MGQNTFLILDKRFIKVNCILLDFSFTVRAATLIFISGRGSAISSAKEGKPGFVYTCVHFMKS